MDDGDALSVARRAWQLHPGGRVCVGGAYFLAHKTGFTVVA